MRDYACEPSKHIHSNKFIFQELQLKKNSRNNFTFMSIIEQSLYASFERDCTRDLAIIGHYFMECMELTPSHEKDNIVYCIHC